MPTTRDILAGKRRMLMEWIDDPLRGQRGKLDNDDVCRALQTAGEVEHATIGDVPLRALLNQTGRFGDFTWAAVC